MMKKFLLFFLFPVFVAAAPLISLDKTAYEYGEQIHFIACGQDLSVTVSCLGDPLTKHPWENNCHMYGFDSENLSCTKPTITAREGMEKSERIFVVRRDRKVLLDTINAETTDVTMMAIKIYAYALLDDTDAIQHLLNELKVLRNEAGKCWPKDACSIETTVDIAYYLHLAGVNRSSRVYDDALLWVEAQQNKVKNDEWHVEMRGDEDTACVLNVDGANTAFAFDEEEFEEKEITYKADAYVNLTCDDSFCIDIFDSFDRSIFDDCGDEDANASFRMYGACWSNKKWQECDAKITSKALLLRGLDAEVYDAGKTWLVDNIDLASNAGSRIQQSSDILSNIYVYNVTGNKDIRTWLLHSQNNDGSFGEGADMTKATLEAVRVFTDLQQEEWMVDALDWLSLTRPNSGWSNLLYDTLQYEIFRTEQPILRLHPSFLTEGEFSLDSIPPYYLKYNLSESLQGVVQVSAPALVNKSRGSVKIVTEEDGVYTGYIIAYNGTFNTQIPVRVQKNPSLTLRPEKTYYLFNTSGTLDIPLVKSSSLLQCTFWFDKFFENETREILGSSSLKVQYNVPRKANTNVSGGYTCTAKTNDLEGTFQFTVRKLSRPPFTATIDTTNISEQAAILEIKSEFDEEMLVQFAWAKDAPFYPIEEQLLIKPGKTKTVYLYQNTPSDINITESNVLRIQALGHTAKIPIMITLDDTPHEIKKKGPWKMIFLVFLFSGIIGGVAVAFQRYMRKKKAKEEKKKQEQEEKKKVKKKPKKKKKKPKTMIEVLIAISRSLGKSEEQIIEELQKKGHKKSEITTALKGLKKTEKDVEHAKEKAEAEKAEEQPAEDKPEDKEAATDEKPEEKKDT